MKTESFQLPKFHFIWRCVCRHSCATVGYSQDLILSLCSGIITGYAQRAICGRRDQIDIGSVKVFYFLCYLYGLLLEFSDGAELPISLNHSFKIIQQKMKKSLIDVIVLLVSLLLAAQSSCIPGILHGIQCGVIEPYVGVWVFYNLFVPQLSSMRFHVGISCIK